ncbi:hypothetical protein EVAR_84445_1 [Eumeta japonica]|uniref:Uncharacterized protein n=1 Tax=Eumeta variegata TaxID=151549 RepID=A0A4C1W455_EUMVA|nr:hypothetical protein EVAR_84445_1 [Eumeta japonica]
MCIRPVMTCACPFFVHATPTALNDLQVIQNNLSRRGTDAQWYVKNLVLHRNLYLPTKLKYMKDESERFFSTAVNHSDPLISSAASYEAPPTNLQITLLEGHEMFLQTRQMTSLLNLPGDVPKAKSPLSTRDREQNANGNSMYLNAITSGAGVGRHVIGAIAASDTLLCRYFPLFGREAGAGGRRPGHAGARRARRARLTAAYLLYRRSDSM